MKSPLKNLRIGQLLRVPRDLYYVKFIGSALQEGTQGLGVGLFRHIVPRKVKFAFPREFRENLDICFDAILSGSPGFSTGTLRFSLEVRRFFCFRERERERNFAMARGPINWSQLVALGLYW